MTEDTLNCMKLLFYVTENSVKRIIFKREYKIIINSF